MTLRSGQRLGPYEVIAVLGAGGMGEVYRARDTRLDRIVAIKVLRDWDGGDRERRARFEREARIIATLDHPRICTLHDVGREGDVDYLVMPYLQGQTLADRLARGALPLDEAIDIAGQIADALDAAHRQSIVHRDLKPGNVMLTRTGVKLLDFGLARVDTSSELGADAVTNAALTAANVVMGTLPYMAPEQIAGRQPDARTDIWAFGCVLYEMLAGRPPFDGPDRGALISAIAAGSPPPLSSLRNDVPKPLEAIVDVALAKDRESRWQSMHDVARMLTIAAAARSVAVPHRSTSRRSRVLALSAAAAATVMLAAFLLPRLHAREEPPVVRFDLDAGAGSIARTTDTSPYFAVSPDGKRIAFVASVGGRRDIWIKSLDGEKPQRLSDTERGDAPFWSPDSQSIAFFADGLLKRKALSGGAAQTICAQQGTGASGSWGSKGTILFTEWATRRLLRVAEGGGVPIAIRQAKASNMGVFGWPEFLPDGRHFVFTRLNLSTSTTEAFGGAIDSDTDRLIPGIASRMAVVDGRILFWQEGSLVARTFDVEAMQPAGPTVPLADRVHAFSLTGFAAFAASPALVVYQAGEVAGHLVWTDRRGLELGTAGPSADIVSIRLSPNADRVAFSARDPRLGTNDLFIHEFTRRVTTRFTSEPGTENAPAWSPDGRTIVYAANRRGPPNLHAKDVNGATAERELVPPSSAGPQGSGVFTPDGSGYVFSAETPGVDRDIFLTPIDGHAPPTVIVRTRGRDVEPRLTRDGKWLAFTSNVSGRSEVYVQPLSDPSARSQVSNEGGNLPVWRGDGRELYFLNPERDGLFAVEVTDVGGTLRLGQPRLMFQLHEHITDYDVTPAADRFLFAMTDPLAERGTLSAILNWSSLISR